MKKILIKQDDFITTFTLLLIFIILSFTYVVFISKYYDYSGFVFLFNIFHLLLSIFIFPFYLISFIRQDNIIIKVSIFFYLIIYCIPNLIMFSFGGMQLYYVLFDILTILFMLIFSKINFKFKFISFKSFESKYVFLFILILLIPYFFSFNLKNINIKNIFLIDVYETRALFRGEGNFYTGYTFSLFSKFLLPSLMIFSLVRKDKRIFYWSIILIVFMYLLGAHKTVLFGPLVLFCFHFFVKLNLDIYKYISISLLLILILMILIWLISDNLIPLSMICRRVFFVPSLLNKAYMDFFINQDALKLSNSFKLFMDYPFTKPIPFVIGEYLGFPEMAANNGIAADAYVNWKYFGVLLYSPVIGLIVNILRSMNVNNSVLIGCVFIIIFTFRSSPLLTSLLTHGILTSIFIIGILFKEKK